MKTLLRLWAKLTGQKLVYLLDHDGEITLTLAFKTPFGFVAKRNGRSTILKSDGTTTNISYLKEWREVDE